MKNILFFYTNKISPSSGGVQKVVSVLYKELSKLGNNVFIIYANECTCKDVLSNQYQLPSKDIYAESMNIDFISNFLQKNQINIVINVAAIMNKASVSIVESCSKTGVPLVSVLHNSYDSLLWSLPCSCYFMKNTFVKTILSSLFYKLQRSSFYKGASYQYKKSVATVFLSDCYLNDFQKNIYIGAKNLYNIYNPLPFVLPEQIEWKDKSNMVLFVGRLERQKNVDALLRIWSKVNTDNWHLYIVGSGSEENSLKLLALKLKICENVHFEGRQSPIEYYKKAKIFCLTSLYEGFPMTLIECQAFGVVPIIYNSFAAANDIINNEENGLLVTKYNEQEFARKMNTLLKDSRKIQAMSISCKEESKKYSIDKVIDKWNTLVNKYSLG